MVKVISLSNESYDRLKALKGLNSFSKAIIELIDRTEKKKKDIMKFAGIFEKSADEWKLIEKELYAERKRAKLKDYKW